MRMKIPSSATLLFMLGFVTASSTFADTVTKREFTKDGVVYIEEKTKGSDGSQTSMTYPKSGQEKQTSTSTTDSAGNVTSSTKVTGPGFQGNISVTQTKEENAAFAKTGNELNGALSACRPF